MQIKLHKNARTTLAVREEIKNSKLSTNLIAKKYNLSWNTVNKWRNSDDLSDKSSRPRKLRTNLSKQEEDLICFERKQFKKTIDDIYLSLENRIDNVYPMKIYRVLKRYNLARLPDEFKQEERKIKKFKNYGIGFVHIDLLYAPKIEQIRRYVYTAIDRVSKVAYIKFSSSKTKESGASFLKEVLKFYPYKINYILTDNGTEFCHNALPKHIKAKQTHPFVKLCLDNEIKHRTTKFCHPWTNGMAERFNRKIKDNVLKKFCFKSIFEMEEKTIDYANKYNHEIKLKSLNYQTPAKFVEINHNLVVKKILF